MQHTAHIPDNHIQMIHNSWDTVDMQVGIQSLDTEWMTKKFKILYSSFYYFIIENLSSIKS